MKKKIANQLHISMLVGHFPNFHPVNLSYNSNTLDSVLS